MGLKQLIYLIKFQTKNAIQQEKWVSAIDRFTYKYGIVLLNLVYKIINLSQRQETIKQFIIKWKKNLKNNL